MAAVRSQPRERDEAEQRSVDRASSWRSCSLRSSYEAQHATAWAATQCDRTISRGHDLLATATGFSQPQHPAVSVPRQSLTNAFDDGHTAISGITAQQSSCLKQKGHHARKHALGQTVRLIQHPRPDCPPISRPRPYIIDPETLKAPTPYNNPIAMPRSHQLETIVPEPPHFSNRP